MPMAGPQASVAKIALLSASLALAWTTLVPPLPALAAEPAQAEPSVPLCGEVDALGVPGEPQQPDAVRELQTGLRMLSMFPYPIDGQYGPNTREAVRQFQRSVGLAPTGIADAKTRDALALAFEEKAEPLVWAQEAAAQAAPGPENLPQHPGATPGVYWIVVDTKHLHLTLYKDGKREGRWPIAVGKFTTMTPVGEWRIANKGYASGVFGTRWMGIDIPFGSYGIHGTNRPWSIGSYASAGCIRMFNHDVERLFEIVSVGTPVTIVGWSPSLAWTNALPAGTIDWHIPLLQWALRREGFDPGRADARLGPDTMKAIAEAQRVLGLPPVDAATPDLFRLLGLRDR